jgi:hypothetical protein
MHARHLCLERHDRGRRRIGIGHARQRQRTGDVAGQRRAHLRHPRRGIEVVLAIGQVEPALQEIGRVTAGSSSAAVIHTPNSRSVRKLVLLSASTSARSSSPSARDRAPRESIAAMRSSIGFSGANPLASMPDSSM